MIGLQLINIIILPIFIALPAIVLYFVIKMAIKKAIKELKDEKII